LGCRNERAKLGFRQIGSTQAKFLCLGLEQFDKPVCDCVYNTDHRERHATLARAAIRRVDHSGHGALQDRVLHHQRVILRLAQRLDSLTRCGSCLVDVKTNGGGADKSDALDMAIAEE